eukprot:Plantae.Rhodophyta-Rhodochaete_pulchella.ctg4191.p1 GENE.Plantae.Rhodophyta-Rhodochaete_pulchella.ctg4191~~Plantae.Rhodophyta-Rhodochaete_pulchella.ctg4191.p1  ORF type:complete len:290 (-),score=20.45 Plantae.Rhodophyta-Rhodochaete_pulchella.ctg4191:240-1109(-)
MHEAAIDPAILWKTGGDPFVFEGAVGMVVEDNLGLGGESFRKLENDIFSQFEKEGRRQLPFTFHGVDISSVENGHRLSQENYRQILPDVRMHPNFKQFQILRGKIAWAALKTRPDILAEVGTCAQVTETTFSDIDVKTLRALVSSVRSRRNTHFLRYGAMNQDMLKIAVYTDAAYAMNQDLASQLGPVVDLQTTLAVSCLSPRDRSRAKIRFPQRWGLHYWHYAKVMYDLCHGLQIELRNVFGRDIPIVVGIDSKSLFDTIAHKTVLSEQRLMIRLQVLRQGYEEARID